jgi:hypothetical protein
MTSNSSNPSRDRGTEQSDCGSKAGAATDASFTRRKFTITEPLDNELVQLAEAHYQGNVSLCIRAAIEDHQQSLRGEGEIATRQLTAQMSELVGQQQSTLETLDAIDDRLPTTEQPHPKRRGSAVSESELSDLPTEAVQVLQVFTDAKDSLRIGDVVDRVELSIREVQTAAGLLVDYGYLVQTNTNTERYRAIGVSPSGLEGKDER